MNVLNIRRAKRTGDGDLKARRGRLTLLKGAGNRGYIYRSAMFKLYGRTRHAVTGDYGL